MDEKDPKDMTAAELLRWAANGEPNKYGSDVVSSKLLSALSGKRFNESTFDEDRANILAIADKIDAEIEAARKDAVKESRKPMRWFRSAIRQGEDWPVPRDGEKFSEYLKRCFIPRPRFEDGEPVQFSYNDIDWDETDECQNPSVRWDATAVDCRGMLLATTFNKIVAVAKTDENGRVKRPTPEVLLADGLPAKVGETVYRVDTGKGFEIARIAPMCPGDDMSETLVLWGDDNEWRAAIDHTHTPPDSQERIDSDAVSSSFAKYWDCSGVGCNECPASIDGKLPDERYGTSGCREAMILDLLRRQRELDKRTGGE